MADLSPLVTQIDEHEQPEKTNLSPQPWELEADTAPSPESLGPGTDTALSPQSTIALPQSLELGTASALSPQSTVALCEKMGKLVLRVEKEMNAKLLQGELPTWPGPQYKSLTEACSYNFANGNYVWDSLVNLDGIQDCTQAEALRLSGALGDLFPEVSAFLKFLGTESKCN